MINQKWLALQLRGKNIRTKRNRKLEWKQFGPFEVVEKLGSQAYRLAIPKHWRIHDTFHVSLLEGFKGREEVPEPSKPSYEAEDIEIEADGENEFFVNAIVDSKIFPAGAVPNQVDGGEYELYYLID